MFAKGKDNIALKTQRKKIPVKKCFIKGNRRKLYKTFALQSVQKK